MQNISLTLTLTPSFYYPNTRLFLSPGCDRAAPHHGAGAPIHATPAVLSALLASMSHSLNTRVEKDLRRT